MLRITAADASGRLERTGEDIQADVPDLLSRDRCTTVQPVEHCADQECEPCSRRNTYERSRLQWVLEAREEPLCLTIQVRLHDPLDGAVGAGSAAEDGAVGVRMSLDIVIRVPLLVLNGDHDTLFRRQDSIELAAGARRATLRLFPEDDHCAMNHYDEWLALSQSWLRESLGCRS